jgi:hypothetical protein
MYYDMQDATKLNIAYWNWVVGDWFYQSLPDLFVILSSSAYANPFQ